MPDETDEIEAVAQELNEKVDGGGCTETWAATAEMREDSSTRRGFMKVGAASISLAVLGAVPTAADEDSDSTPYNELGSQEAQHVLSEIEQTEEFNQLKARVDDNGGSLRKGNVIVGRVENDTTTELVSIPVDNAGSDEAYLTVGKTTGDQEVVVATLEYVTKNEDGTAERIVFDAQQGMERSVETADPDQDEFVVRPSDQLVAQDVDIGCSGCQTAIRLLCRIGCGASTAFICGVLTGAGLIVGGGCFAFTQAACRVLAAFDCAGQIDVEEVCSDPRLGLC